MVEAPFPEFPFVGYMAAALVCLIQTTRNTIVYQYLWDGIKYDIQYTLFQLKFARNFS